MLPFRDPLFHSILPVVGSFLGRVHLFFITNPIKPPSIEYIRVKTVLDRRRKYYLVEWKARNYTRVFADQVGDVTQMKRFLVNTELDSICFDIQSTFRKSIHVKVNLERLKRLPTNFRSFDGEYELSKSGERLSILRKTMHEEIPFNEIISERSISFPRPADFSRFLGELRLSIPESSISIPQEGMDFKQIQEWNKIRK